MINPYSKTSFNDHLDKTTTSLLGPLFSPSLGLPKLNFALCNGILMPPILIFQQFNGSQYMPQGQMMPPQMTQGHMPPMSQGQMPQMSQGHMPAMSQGQVPMSQGPVPMSQSQLTYSGQGQMPVMSPGQSYSQPQHTYSTESSQNYNNR